MRYFDRLGVTARPIASSEQPGLTIWFKPKTRIQIYTNIVYVIIAENHLPKGFYEFTIRYSCPNSRWPSVP